MLCIGKEPACVTHESEEEREADTGVSSREMLRRMR